MPKCFNNILRAAVHNLLLPLNVRQRVKRCYLHPNFDFKQTDLGSLNGLQRNSAARTQRAGLTGIFPFQRNVLVVDYQIPMPDRDSGSMRMTAILRLLGEIGFRATFVNHSGNRMPQYEKPLEEQGIGIICGFNAAQRHLMREGEKYHFVVLSRPVVTFKYLLYARKYAPNAIIIYDTVDLHWIRFEREMRLSGDRNLIRTIEHFRRMELMNAAGADMVFAITNEEKSRLLAEYPDMNVVILPNIHEPAPPQTPFRLRSGIMFVGGFQHRPNEDAVFHFVNDILPAIVGRMPDIVFYIIGSDMPASVKALRSPNVEPLGFVADVSPYFESCRLFVAPLRFGAGMKGKVGQSMSRGLPVVATPIGAEGMGLVNEKHALIAQSSRDFAEAVVRLYNDEILWNIISTQSFSHLEANYSGSAVRKQMVEIFARLL